MKPTMKQISKESKMMDDTQRRTYQILTAMKNYLVTTKFAVSKAHRDGRINSAHDEDIIVAHLRKRFSKSVFRTSNECGISNRCWWDIWLVETNTPVNLKSSTHKSGDNACNFLALLWALTDVEVEPNRTPHAGRDTAQYIKALRSSILPAAPRDYWFLSINKCNHEDIVINSIRGLTKAIPNCNNLPFQINWSHNKNFVSRDILKARKYYNDVLKRSFAKDWRLLLYETVQREN